MPAKHVDWEKCRSNCEGGGSLSFSNSDPDPVPTPFYKKNLIQFRVTKGFGSGFCSNQDPYKKNQINIADNIFNTY